MVRPSALLFVGLCLPIVIIRHEAQPDRLPRTHHQKGKHRPIGTSFDFSIPTFFIQSYTLRRNPPILSLFPYLSTALRVLCRKRCSRSLAFACCAAPGIILSRGPSSSPYVQSDVDIRSTKRMDRTAEGVYSGVLVVSMLLHFAWPFRAPASSACAPSRERPSSWDPNRQ